MRDKSILGSVLSLLCALAWAGSARAQMNPETGDTGGAAGGQFQGGVQAQGSWQPAPAPAPMDPMAPPPGVAPMAPPPEEPAAPPGSSDHSAMVGHFGVGFFGVTDLPVTICEGAVCAMPTAGDLDAPSIGARYWLSEFLGVEAAIGLNVTSSETGMFENSNVGFAIHGGVPLALAHDGHFVFQLVPQLNFGVASGSYETTGTLAGTKSDVSGLLFEIGATAGAEIHFGFIDIPQLALQGTIGLMLRHESRSVETTVGATPPVEVDQSALRIATSVEGEPWDIFTGSIAAIYYF